MFLFCFTCQVVTAHGICHLLGYRHETEEEWLEVCMEMTRFTAHSNRSLSLWYTKIFIAGLWVIHSNGNCSRVIAVKFNQKKKGTNDLEKTAVTLYSRPFLKCIVLSLKHLHPYTCSHSQVCLYNCLDGDFIYGLLLWFLGSIQSKFLVLMNHNLNLMVSP